MLALDGTPINRLLLLRNTGIVQTVSDMTVNEKRRVFSILRKIDAVQDMNYIFPAYHGITIGEFCIGHVIHSDTNRSKRKRDT